MKYILLLSILFYYPQSLFSQSTSEDAIHKLYFSEQIALHINAYRYKIGKAKAAQDYKRVAQLYNEFIEQKLVGSYLDHFNIDCFDRKKNNLGDFNKPLVLLTYADWCGPMEEEIKVFNEYTEKYHDKIDFLILIWGDKKQARQLSKPFHRKTKVLYLNELRNRDEHTVRMLKHAIGVPTIIVTNAKKKIKNIIKPSATFPTLFEHDFQYKFSNAILGLDLSQVIK